MDAGLDGLVVAITKDLKFYMFNPLKNNWVESRDHGYRISHHTIEHPNFND